MKRGELRLAEVGRKRRPVLVITRSEVIDVRALVAVAEVTTTTRGLATEVHLDHVRIGLDRPSVVNCRTAIHTVARRSPTTLVGRVDDDVMRRVSAAVNYGFGC